MSLPEYVTIDLPSGHSYKQPTGLFINNKFVPSIKGGTLSSINPATGQPNATIYKATEEDVNVAVKTAREVFDKTWKKTSPTDRSSLLHKLADLIDKNKELLSAIEAHDSGKPFTTNAAGDIEDVFAVFKYYAGWADKIHGKTIPLDKDHLIYTVHEPLGVTGQIIPWNYPLDMLAWKIAPSLAAGNTVVLKTSELTPLSALFFANLFVEAGFPAGVVNILSGTGVECGKPLASHPGISKVAFTGSTNVGKLISQYAAQNLTPVSMETGGKSPAVVFSDANLEKVAYWTAFGIFFNSGQVCSATSRILVHELVHDELVELLTKLTKKSYLNGDPFSDKIADTKGITIVGPQVSEAQQKKILDYIEIGKKEGARVVTGGSKPEAKALASGFYVQPTIFDNVTKDMRIFKEEIFGPVVTVTTFSTEEEAIELANDTQYGLGASVFTTDLIKAHHVADEIESGTVWINSSNEGDPKIPFGGVKKSGFGRELGEYALSLYTHVKAVTVNLER